MTGIPLHLPIGRGLRRGWRARLSRPACALMPAAWALADTLRSLAAALCRVTAGYQHMRAAGPCSDCGAWCEPAAWWPHETAAEYRGCSPCVRAARVAKGAPDGG